MIHILRSIIVGTLGVLFAGCVAAIEKPLPPDPVPPVPRWVLCLSYFALAVFTLPASVPLGSGWAFSYRSRSWSHTAAR